MKQIFYAAMAAVVLSQPTAYARDYRLEAMTIETDDERCRYSVPDTGWEASLDPAIRDMAGSLMFNMELRDVGSLNVIASGGNGRIVFTKRFQAFYVGDAEPKLYETYNFEGIAIKTPRMVMIKITKGNFAGVNLLSGRLVACDAANNDVPLSVEAMKEEETQRLRSIEKMLGTAVDKGTGAAAKALVRFTGGARHILKGMIDDFTNDQIIKRERAVDTANTSALEAYNRRQIEVREFCKYAFGGRDCN